MDLQQQTSAKLVLLGEMGSGKSSLVLRYVKGTYFDDLVSAKMLNQPNLKKQIPSNQRRERERS